MIAFIMILLGIIAIIGIFLLEWYITRELKKFKEIEW